MAHVKQGEFGEHQEVKLGNTEPSLRNEEGVETMYPAQQNIAGEEIVRPARIPEGAENGRNDRSTDVKVASGFIVGEGSINISLYQIWGSGSPNYELSLTAAQTNLEPLLLLQRLFGGAIHKRKLQPRCKQSWQWKVAATKAETALREMAPYLLHKRSEVQLALEFREHIRSHGGGRRLTEEEVAVRRSFSDRLKRLHVTSGLTEAQSTSTPPTKPSTTSTRRLSATSTVRVSSSPLA